MNLDPQFAGEYDPRALIRITPRGHDFEMTVPPRYRHHFVSEDYEPASARLIGRLARRADCFLDIGAHCGFFSLVAARANPALSIIAVEPTPETAAILRSNIAAVPMRSVSIIEAAISSLPGTARFHKSAASDSCGLYEHPNAPTVELLDVATITVDALLADCAPHSLLIKIDTEGHELAVLDGMRQTLSVVDDIALLIEFNPKMIARSGQAPRALLDRLDQLGFDVFAINEVTGALSRLSADASDSLTASYVNIYCRRKGILLSVAFLSHSAGLAGAERSLCELVTALVRDRDIVATVIVPQEGPLVVALREAGAGCIMIDGLSWWAAVGMSKIDARSRLARGGGPFLGGLLPCLRDLRPDVVFTQTSVIPWGATAASLLRIGHVWSICEFGEDDHGLNFVQSAADMARDVLEGSNVTLTNSRAVRDALFPIVDQDKIHVVYRHIQIPAGALADPEGFETGSIPQPWRRPGAVRLGIFATLMKGKGHEDALHAVRRLIDSGHDAELVCAGYQTEYQAALEMLARDLDISDRVTFAGFFVNPYPLMRAADIVLVCSRKEAFGRVAIEAMLLERPVIYANAGGICEYMIDGTTGLSYLPGDPAGLASRVVQLIDDPDLRVRLGQNGRAHVNQRFTADAFDGEIARLLRAAATAKSHARPLSRAIVDALSHLPTNPADVSASVDRGAYTAALAERDAAQRWIDAYQPERVALHNERAARINERDALHNECNALRRWREHTAAERDAAVAERDAMVVEIQRLNLEIKTMREAQS